MIRLVRKIAHDCLTGPDGETYAVGRLSAIPTLLSGLAVPFVMIWKGQTVSLTDLAVLYGGLGGAFMAMVRGTNSTEPPAEGQ